MQESLKNTHYKKIWERMNCQIRHPEAESLEEALEMEAKEDECYILQSENSNPQMHAVLEEIRGDYPFYDKFQILGRPITLTDILKLLYKPNNECLPEARLMPTNYWEIAELPKGLYVSIHAHEVLYDRRLFWWNITTDLLEEQTPETWEKIANLI